MKIRDEWKFEGSSIVRVEDWDSRAECDSAGRIRDFHRSGGKLLNFLNSECEPQYAYPPHLELEWSRKWGVSMDDPAFDSIIQMELNSGNYEKLRVDM